MIKASEIEELLNRNKKTCSTFKTEVGPSRALIEAFLVQLAALETNDYKDPMTFDALAEEKKKELHGKLSNISAALAQIVSDGPTDPESSMYKAYSSNPTITLLGAWAILGIVVLLCLIGDFGRLAGINKIVLSQIPLIAIMGALGGFLSCSQSLGRYIGNRQLLRSWTIYYLLFPLKGAGLAIIVYFMFNTDNLAGQTGQTTQKFTAVGFCLLAALTGLFSNQAIEMLGNLFSVLFRKVDGKDTYSDTVDLTINNTLNAPANPRPIPIKVENVASNQNPNTKLSS